MSFPQMHSLTELNKRVEMALSLLTGEEADALIGKDAQDEYNALIQGASAVVAMDWAAAKRFGLRQTGASLKQRALVLTIVLCLIQYAYALGIRRGRSTAGQ